MDHFIYNIWIKYDKKMLWSIWQEIHFIMLILLLEMALFFKVMDIFRMKQELCSIHFTIADSSMTTAIEVFIRMIVQHLRYFHKCTKHTFHFPCITCMYNNIL